LVHTWDSGLLEITQPGQYVYLDMGESTGLKLGQWVMAVGHPGGFEETRGIVVRVGRILTLTSRVIRTDCTLVGGDSGGPLVDMDGYVIGIHSRIGARLSDNMHVPINVYLEGWDQLEADQEIGGRPGRPGLGITLKGDDGLEIESVEPDGPADKAGVQPGDVVLELNARAIQTRLQLGQALDELEIGSAATLKVLRGDQEIELPLVIGRR
jgi:serine protease Do